MSRLEQILGQPDPTDLIIALGDYLWQKSGEDFSLNTLNVYEKRMLLVFWMEAEVNNGGFDQFFFNSTGAFAEETAEALSHIHAPLYASIFQKALDAFPVSPVPKDEGERREILDELDDEVSDVWNALEDRFYECEENLTEQLIAYVQTHRPEFS